MKVLVLGGAGLMAEATEIDFIKNDPGEISKITVADISPESIKNRVEKLNSPKVYGEVVNIGDKGSLVKLIKNHDIVVHAALGDTIYPTLMAALEAGVNIVTLLGPYGDYAKAQNIPLDEFGEVTEEFRDKMDNDFKEAGLIGVLGLGSAPGTTNVLGRYLGEKFDTIETMEFSYVYAHEGEKKTFFAFDPLAMVMQYTTQPLVFKDGKFVLLPPRSGRAWAQYPEPIGMTETFYIRHSEATDFSRFYRDKGIQNVGTKSGWGSDFLKKMEFLDTFGLLDLEPKKVGDVSVVPADVLLSGVYGEKGIKVEKEAKVLDYGCTRLEIIGDISGDKVEYVADVLSSPYENLGGTQQRTGIPAAVGVRMIGRGEINRKGCYFPHVGIDPKIYFRELAKRNIEVSYRARYLI